MTESRHPPLTRVEQDIWQEWVLLLVCRNTTGYHSAEEVLLLEWASAVSDRKRAASLAYEANEANEAGEAGENIRKHKNARRRADELLRDVQQLVLKRRL